MLDQGKNKIEGLDKGIAPAVEILNNHGFETFESCQGGEGHCYNEPTVRFFGDEFSLIRAYETCRCYGLNVSEAKRVFIKVDVYKNNISANQMPFGVICISSVVCVDSTSTNCSVVSLLTSSILIRFEKSSQQIWCN